MSPGTKSSTVRFVTGEVIYHHWDDSHQLVERSRAFRSFNELLDQCFSPPARHVVDRVVMTGRDAQGHRRQLVLGFQSLTEP